MESLDSGVVAANLGASVRRLLAISWAMPPLLAPRALQVPLNLKYLAQQGWEITVITASHRPPWKGMRYDPALETRFHDMGFTIVPVESPERSLLRRALWRYIAPLRPVPDNQRPWSHHAVQAAQNLLKAVPYDSILSFAVPWSDHLVGLELHRQTGIPWIAHFSDPWVDSPYFAGSGRVRRMSEQLEEAVIREADRVVFVTNQTVDLVMKKYPAEWRKKVCVIPHGYEPSEQPTQSRVEGKQDRLRLIYTGTFYGLRSPAPLFHALHQLRDTSLAQYIDVKLVGQIPEKYGYQRLAHELGLDDIVHFTGVLPYARTQAITAEADVLLVIDAANLESSVFLPSKLVDYLPFQKPIVGITPLQGASAELIRRLGCQVAAPDDVEAIARVLADLVETWRAGNLSVGADYLSAAADYDIRRISHEFDALLRELKPSV
jgi:glycosyltransferase involved in cell wall biosynthesis